MYFFRLIDGWMVGCRKAVLAGALLALPTDWLLDLHGLLNMQITHPGRFKFMIFFDL